VSDPVQNELGRRFVGRVALVTGAGHGIGRAVAERLAAEGARLVLADLDEAAAMATADQLAPADAVATACDVHVTSSVDACIDLAVRHFGQLDVLVNVAGGSIAMPAFEDITDEAWNEMLDLNLTGAMRCIRAALPQLRRRPTAVIVSITSVNGLAAFGEEAYSSAKAGLSLLTRNLAIKLGPEGIPSTRSPRAQCAPGSGTARTAAPIGCGRCIRWAGWGSRATSPRPWRSWPPTTPPGSPA